MLNGSKQIVEENWSKSYFLRETDFRKLLFTATSCAQHLTKKKLKKKRPAHRSAALNNLIERSKLDNAAKYHDLEEKGQWCANLNNMKRETIC